MSLLSRPRLVLLEIACAAALVALAFKGVWLVIGAVVAVTCLALALVSVRRRSLHLVVRSWLAMRSRKRQLKGQGIASLAGGTYEVVTVPSVGGGTPLGAIRDATTWSVPLSLPLSDIFNEDIAIPLDRLANLLTVEDVPLSSVRLVTTIAPVAIPPGTPDGPVPPASRLATRHLVLTLDTLHAADVIAERGGVPAINQILRRCVLRAEEVLSSAGVEVRRLPEKVVALDSASCLGPVPVAADGSLPTAVEALNQVRLDNTVAQTFAVTGADAVAKLDLLATLLPVPIVATSVVLHPGTGRQPPTYMLLLRVSGSTEVVRSAEEHLKRISQGLSLHIDRVIGEQVPLLKATTLLGVAMEAA
ncbi:hypothetical protein [Nocardioides jensenii]|uniref:hypothetical protein n=1 Tax=Nocardioides jensenii TaxID=1843 RepID=UPI00082D74A1|nr:hypothetical protein [Nocardioides jensenii]